jgi:hypothetical protein
MDSTRLKVYLHPMKNKFELRAMRLDEWVAESLEAKASQVLPSCKVQADSLLHQAQHYRKVPSNRSFTASQKNRAWRLG